MKRDDDTIHNPEVPGWHLSFPQRAQNKSLASSKTVSLPAIVELVSGSGSIKTGAPVADEGAGTGTGVAGLLAGAVSELQTQAK